MIETNSKHFMIFLILYLIYLQWGSNKNLLAVNTIANVFMLSEHTMSSGYKEQVSSH